jgi:hypothetical protein
VGGDVASTIESLRDDGRAVEARTRCDATPEAREAGALELAPPPEPECDCRAALRRILGARDRYLAALGDGAAPFQLPEEDEYLASLAAARDLFAKG